MKLACFVVGIALSPATEATLKEMRPSDPPISCLVGAPRARWDRCKDAVAKVPWQKLRDTVEVKLPAPGNEVYVLAKRQGRVIYESQHA